MFPARPIHRKGATTTCCNGFGALKNSTPHQVLHTFLAPPVRFNESNHCCPPLPPSPLPPPLTANHPPPPPPPPEADVLYDRLLPSILSRVERLASTDPKYAERCRLENYCFMGEALKSLAGRLPALQQHWQVGVRGWF